MNQAFDIRQSSFGRTGVEVKCYHRCLVCTKEHDWTHVISKSWCALPYYVACQIGSVQSVSPP